MEAAGDPEAIPATVKPMIAGKKFIRRKTIIVVTTPIINTRSYMIMRNQFQAVWELSVPAFSYFL